jgi:hypothetical protein
MRPKNRATAQDEEHLLSAEVHMEATPGRAGRELIERRAHARVIGSPEGEVARTGVFFVSLAEVGEEMRKVGKKVLSLHCVVPPCE